MNRATKRCVLFALISLMLIVDGVALANGQTPGHNVDFSLPAETAEVNQFEPSEIHMNGTGGILYAVNFGNGIWRIGNCREWVNLRADPSTKNPPLGRVYLRDAVTILGWNQDKSWARVAVGGMTGWVFGKFVVR